MKGKPIGVRFDEEMVSHFKEVHKIESYQMMLNYLWGAYAAKAGIWKGKIKVPDIKEPPKEETPKFKNSLEQRLWEIEQQQKTKK